MIIVITAAGVGFRNDESSSVAVLDEAGATAETHAAQLLRLGVENLVLLGDHETVPESKELNQMRSVCGLQWWVAEEEPSQEMIPLNQDGSCRAGIKKPPDLAKTLISH